METGKWHDTGAETLTVAVSATSAPLRGPSPHCRTLILCPHPTLDYSISWDRTAVIGQGVTVYAKGFPIFLRREVVGSVLGQALNIVASGSGTVGVIEIQGCPCDKLEVKSAQSKLARQAAAAGY